MNPSHGGIDTAFQIIEAGSRNGEGGRRAPLAELMRDTCVPGASIAAFAGAELIATRSYGVREAGGKEPSTSRSLFQAASISKPVTAVATMLLVEDGRLALDEDVNAYLRSWKVPAMGTWQPHLTARQLRSHTAGLTVRGFPGYERGQPVPEILAILDGRAPANTPPVHVDALPGLAWRYAGGGTTILQLLLTDLTGLPFQELMQSLVLEPLGMARSTFTQPLPEDQRRDASSGHAADGQPIAGSWRVYPEMAAAGLWSTAADLARFARGTLAARSGQPGSILRAESVAEMLRRQVSDLGDAMAVFDGMGLGFFLAGGDRTLCFGHAGGNSGFRCLLAAFPEQEAGLVLMTNGDNGDRIFSPVLAAFTEACGLPELPGPPAPPSDAEAATFVGEYLVRPGLTIAISQSATGLFLLLPRQEPLPLRPLGGDRFAIGVLAAAVTFRRGSDGSVRGLLLHQNLRDVPAAKAD
ncbi:MAG: serine hydrolase domain-containing protein [Dehalococcoidia bacterium]